MASWNMPVLFTVVYLLVALVCGANSAPSWLYRPPSSSSGGAADLIERNLAPQAAPSYLDQREGGAIMEMPETRSSSSSSSSAAGEAKVKAAKMKAMMKMVNGLRGESLIAKLLERLLTEERVQYGNEYSNNGGGSKGGLDDDEELRRLNRNYYGWMDFGKRSVSEDDFSY